ncbi:hypothetical protein L9F63_014792, partial [Diploptera punctata]
IPLRASVRRTIASPFPLLIILTIAVRIYIRITTGICKSTRRMDGKTVIVTGANTGIGKETAHDLAQRGAKVILACRDLKRGKEACENIIEKTGNKKVVLRHLDLSSLASVRKFANEIIKTELRLDVLINNAGAGGLGNKKTTDGLLIGMQINHFGPFLLTCLLLDLMKKSSPSRIIMVSSFNHKLAKFDIDNLNSEKWFSDVQVYNCSKLANVLMANELANKLKGTEKKVWTVNSLHPGAVKTEILRRVPSFVLFFVNSLLIRPFFKNVRDGAQTTIHLAVSEEVEGVTGKYFADCK